VASPRQLQQLERIHPRHNTKEVKPHKPTDQRPDRERGAAAAIKGILGNVIERTAQAASDLSP
jgi:hypothetical protein